MEEIHNIAREYHLLVIEDAAHALGADYQGEKIGSMSDMTTLSFHPVKHITTGEGGMVLTNQKEFYEKLLRYRSHGITRETIHSKDVGDWYYEQLELGYNYRITDFQCALGSSQLQRLEQFITKRRVIAKRYDDAFSSVAEIQIPYQVPGCHTSWHLYVIQVPEEKRQPLFEFLRGKGIGVNVHYIPVYWQPYYQSIGYGIVECKNAEKVYARSISLPIYPLLKEEEQDYVIKQVIDYMGK